MCTEFPLGGKAGRRHPCDRGHRQQYRYPQPSQKAKAITKGCIEALYVKHLLEHQTARPFKIEVWTDSSSAKAILQRPGPEQDQSHLAEQVEYAGKCVRFVTKHVPKAVLDKLAGMMGYTFPGEESQKFQEYANINQNYWKQKMTAVERLPVFDDGENEWLEDDVRSSVDKMSHLTTVVLRRSVEMNIL